MKLFNFYAFFCLIAVYCTAVYCEQVQFQLCPATPTHKCEIKSVTVDPCPEANDNNTCNLYRETNVTWIFTMVPKFSADNLTILAGSYVPGQANIYHHDMDRDACKNTNCPIVSGQEITAKFVTPILKTYPTAPFTSIWRFINPSNDECCLLVPIVIW